MASDDYSVRDFNSDLQQWTSQLQRINEFNAQQRQNQQIMAENAKQNEWARNFNERQFAESQRQFDVNYGSQLAAMNQTQSNFENQYQIRAADMAKAGLNPISAVDSSGGQSVSFSPQSNVAGSASGAQSNLLAPNSIAEIMMRMAEINSEKAERRRDRIELAKQRQHELDMQNNQLALDYAALQETSQYHQSDVDERAARLQFDVMRAVEDVRNQRSMLNETKRNNMYMNYLQKLGLDQNAAKLALQEAFQDKHFQYLNNQLSQAKTIADNDRRMQYITRFGTEILRDLTQIVTETGFGKIFGGAKDLFKRFGKKKPKVNPGDQGLDGFDWFDWYPDYGQF